MTRASRRRSWRAIGPLLILAILALGSARSAAADPVTPPWRDLLPEARPRITVELGDESVEATLAETSEEQTLGLGYRDELADGTGMLFVYDEPGMHSFWMKGMRFCLDIVWIENGQIVGAAERVCPSPAGTPDADLPRFQSPEPVRYVLEVPAGWLDEHGLGEGTPVTFDPPIEDPLPSSEG